MLNIGQKILNAVNLDYDDQPAYIPQLLPNPEKFLTWADVEECANRPELWQFELIDQNNSKVEIPRSLKTWEYDRLIQDKKFIIDHINAGCSAVIPNYGYKNQYTNELLNVFERLFKVYAAIHVYCGLAGGKSFTIHDDYPVNFIIQVEGETRWKVFKNRISYLYGTGKMNGMLNEDMLEVAVDVVLKPGDALYIPSRAYHVAYPTGPRLSMSIPCWQKISTESRTLAADRNYYKINYERNV